MLIHRPSSARQTPGKIQDMRKRGHNIFSLKAIPQSIWSRYRLRSLDFPSSYLDFATAHTSLTISKQFAPTQARASSPFDNTSLLFRNYFGPPRSVQPASTREGRTDSGLLPVGC